MTLKLDLNESATLLSRGYGYARPNEYLNSQKVLAKYAGVKPENIVITNGSYHALDLIFSFLFKHKAKIILPVPTFLFYEKHEETRKLNFIKVPFDENLLTVLDEPKIAGLYLDNPNNPIGYTRSSSELEQIVTKAETKKVLVIIDEAYFEFCGITVKSLVDKYHNLIVVRTLSKAFGLPGARAGYIITNSKLAKKLERLKGPPYIISQIMLSIVSKTLASKTKKISMKNYVKDNNLVKKKLIGVCHKKKILYFPSQANFLTVKLKDATKFTISLEKQKILVKNLSNYTDGLDLLKNCVRITIPPLNKLEKITSNPFFL